MGLRSRTLACAETRTRQTQRLQHPSGLYRSHGRVVADPEVMRRNLILHIIANALLERCFGLETRLGLLSSVERPIRQHKPT
jgi:hypothetical protein